MPFPDDLEPVRVVRGKHITTIERVLGINPQGGYDSVAARLDAIGGGGGEVLTVGPGGDIPFREIFVAGQPVLIGSGGGAPAFENGWENNGESFFQGLGGANEEGEGFQTYTEFNFKRSGGASAATIYTLPVGNRPLKKVTVGNVVFEVDGKVHLDVAAESAEGEAAFDSEYEATLTPVAEPIPGFEVTVHKDPDGTVMIRGFAKRLKSADPVFTLPEGFRPAQLVYADEDRQIDADGGVFTLAEAVLPVEGDPIAYLFDALPPFKAA